MDNRLATLLTRGASLTRAEYRVLAHLTEHPLLVGNITVRELAKATFVSTATIMRLCQKRVYLALQAAALRHAAYCRSGAVAP